MPGTHEGRVCDRLDAELGAGSSAGLDADYSAYLDAELAPERAAQLEAHLAGCAACRGRLAALGGVDAALSALEPGAVPPDLQARLLSRVADAASEAGSPARLSPPPRRLWLTRPSVLASAALAAAAAVAVSLWPSPPHPVPSPQLGERPLAVVPPASVSPSGAGSAPPRASSLAEGTGTEVAAQQPEAASPGESLDPASDPALLEEGLRLADQTELEPLPVDATPAFVPDLAPAPARAPGREAAGPTALAAAEASPSAAELPEPSKVELASAEAEATPEIALPVAASDEELAELALALELTTLEDFDVIANLDLLELLVALEEDSG